MNAVYFVHGRGLETPVLAVRPAQRETLVDPPAALRIATTDVGASCRLTVSTLGTVVLIQEVGKAATQEEAKALYDDETFGPSYERAKDIGREYVTGGFEDFSFSFVLHCSDDPNVIAQWTYVRAPADLLDVVVEATHIWCLADTVEQEVRALPLQRAGGSIEPAFVARALDLFSFDEPSQVWTSEREIALLEVIYAGWGLRMRVEDLRARFDRAASGFSFFWEASERRRETTLSLALAVVAVVGLLQADAQLDRVTGLGERTIDWIIVVSAVLLVLLTIGNALRPRLPLRRGSKQWAALERLLR